MPGLFYLFCTFIINISRLCGISPFHGNSYHEVLAKNKAGNVIFYEKYWAAVSPEGKDLVMQMVKKNPAERISAQAALEHKWFTMAQTRVVVLSSAIENMKKYHNKENENRFNVSAIKPEFATLTRTPVMGSRFASGRLQDSSVLFRKNQTIVQSPDMVAGRQMPEIIKVIVFIY